MSGASDPSGGYARFCPYNRHLLRPRLEIPSRVAWYLAWRAHRERRRVAALIPLLLAEYVDALIADLGQDDLASLARSIPFSRGPDGPNVRTTGIPKGTQEKVA